MFKAIMFSLVQLQHSNSNNTFKYVIRNGNCDPHSHLRFCKTAVDREIQ